MSGKCTYLRTEQGPQDLRTDRPTAQDKLYYKRTDLWLQDSKLESSELFNQRRSYFRVLLQSLPTWLLTGLYSAFEEQIKHTSI